MNIKVVIISQTKNLINGNNHIKIIQSYDDNALDRNQELSQILEIYDQRHLRSISDLWQSIKNTAVSTWNHIKNIANKTKDKIQAIIGQMKDKIAQIQANFEERLKELQNQVKDLIDKAISTGQNIKECIQKEKEAIDKIAKEILRNVTTCVSENILQLSHLEGTLKIDIDEKDFQNKLDIRLDECVLKEDIDEECLHGVREELFCEVEKIEIDVLQRGEQSRNLAEDILQAIISCTTEGLIAASTNITMEAITVVKCAAEESETGTEAIPI